MLLLLPLLLLLWMLLRLLLRLLLWLLLRLMLGCCGSHNPADSHPRPLTPAGKTSP